MIKSEEKNSIFVENYETNCLIGIYPEEKKRKQRIRISITLETSKANFQDDPEKILSYEKIIDKLQEITSLKHINLLETLSNNLSSYFLNFNEVISSNIKIEKLDILKGNGSVGVIHFRSLK